ncbi:MAG TPA: DUF1801 domain-containing protein [Cytophagales bacterium]|nr:DUF1801 domain-containing protein [Cytophagales bacterium]
MKKIAPKKQMQNVSFHSLDDFFEFIPSDEKKILEALRKIIFECIPDCEEKLAYNVPFYKRHSNICFLWPASVTWGGVKQKGVRMGFTSGYLLHDEIGYLYQGKRKQVTWRDFTNVSEIDSTLLSNYLHEAALVDQEKAKLKISQKQKNLLSNSKKKKLKH